MNYSRIQAALRGVVQSVHHYRASDGTLPPYAVWAEDGEAASLMGDNMKIAQAMTGTIDYFTRTEYDPKAQQIQDALNGLEIFWRLASVQREEDTGLIHYEWVWEIWRA